MAERKREVHKLNWVVYAGPTYQVAVCGITGEPGVEFEKNWRGVTCKNCLRAKRKGG